MNLTKRFTLFLSGAFLASIVLLFINGDNQMSCSYFPNARVIKSITDKKPNYSGDILAFLKQKELDTADFKKMLVKRASVDFKNSNVDLESCKKYAISFRFKDSVYLTKVENCDSIAYYKSIKTILND